MSFRELFRDGNQIVKLLIVSLQVDFTALVGFLCSLSQLEFYTELIRL